MINVMALVCLVSSSRDIPGIDSYPTMNRVGYEGGGEGGSYISFCTKPRKSRIVFFAKEEEKKQNHHRLLFVITMMK